MSGCTLQELQSQLEVLNKLKKDFILPANCISMQDGNVNLSNLDQFKDLLNTPDVLSISVEPTNLFKSQLSEKLGISLTYQDRLLGKLDSLYELNVNELLKYEALNGNRSFLIRTFGNTARAFLSNSFKIIDHTEVIDIILQAMENLKFNYEVDYCSLSEERMYCRFYSKDNPMSGFILSNSEIGKGTTFLAPRLKLGKGAYTWYSERVQKKHLGPKLANGAVYYSGQKALLAKFQSAIKLFCSSEHLQNCRQVLDEIGAYVLKNPHNTILKVCSYLKIEDSDTVVGQFVKGKSYTALDAIQVVSDYGQTIKNADHKFEIECNCIKALHLIEHFDK